MSRPVRGTVVIKRAAPEAPHLVTFSLETEFSPPEGTLEAELIGTAEARREKEALLGTADTQMLMGTLPEAELVHHMKAADALVIMKTGRNLPTVKRALEQAGKLDDAWLVEKGSMPGQRVAKLADVDEDDCPYFAIVLVHGQGRRPEAAE